MTEDTRTADPGGLREALMAEALAAWWADDGTHMPGLDAWDDAGGWDNDARILLREYDRIAVALTPEATAPDARE
jgi:hypothetical protein